MKAEKIITIYPTIAKPGLVPTPFMTPDPLFIAQAYPDVCSFYLTAMMYFEHGKKYTTELDVTFNGKSVLPEVNGEQNRLETFMFSPINDETVLVGTSLLVEGVKISGSGTYDVVFRIFEDIDGRLSEVIDEKKCAIISTTNVRD